MRLILLLIMRGHMYIFIFVPVWQKNNKSLTPVSQVNYRNFCPNLSSLSFTEAYLTTYKAARYIYIYGHY